MDTIVARHNKVLVFCVVLWLVLCRSWRKLTTHLTITATESSTVSIVVIHLFLSSYFKALLPCKLNYLLLKRLFNSCNATWIINDEALVSLNNDLQSVIECSEPGEFVLFQVSHVIQPSRTMVIPHNLIFTNEGSDDLSTSNEETYPTSFTCPTASPLLEIE